VAQAANAGESRLDDCIKEVAATPPAGAVESHQAYISRRALRQEETAATLEFEVTLKMRNLAELQDRVSRGELISPQEMSAKYDPAPADYQAVRKWITKQGFTVSREDTNRMAIFATGKVSQIGQALQVDFARVMSDSVEFTSAISAPVVPDAVAPLLVGINGLQPHLRAHKHAFAPMSLTGTGAPYTPSQIAHVYNADTLYQSSVTGAGQTIAIVIDTVPATTDLQGFWTTYGINQSLSNISFIQVVAGTLSAPTGEETLDTEWSSAMAPGAKVRVYATLALSNANVDAAYAQINADVTNHPEYEIHQVSLSIAEGEAGVSLSQVTTDHQYFTNLAAAGVTVFASSDDGGNSPDQQGQTQGTRSEQAAVPASDPFVTAVGGTSLQLDSNGNVSTESAWSYSGGGPSRFFNRPTWQVGAGIPNGTTRLLPHVASAADPSYGCTFYFNGSQQSTGGTSWSTPTWAGFGALINQTRAKASLASIGLLGPRIYPLLGTANFRDITSGNNGFPAGAGYDLVTGLGVPNVKMLAQTLAGAPVTTSYTPPPTAILHNFNDGGVVDDGQTPTGMTQGSDGNFYGVTMYGGPNYYSPAGTVFKMTPQGAVTILHYFGYGGTANDGANPNNGLVQDSSGDLFGTTRSSGANGYGTIFEISTAGTTTTLYSFDGTNSGGTTPMTGMVKGADGNFYGITSGGQFYEMTPQGGFTLIQNLTNIYYSSTYAPLMLGADGKLYGTTYYGGTGESGTIFSITTQGVVTIVYQFGVGNSNVNPDQPASTLVQGPDGTFYGVTYGTTGNTTGGGVVFALSTQGVLSILHYFGDGTVPSDGMHPQGNLVLGTDGNLYGTTHDGGTAGNGVVFKVSLAAPNTYSIVHNFGDGSLQNDGSNGGILVAASDGNIFGITSDGGENNEGTVFGLDYFTNASSATFAVGYAGVFDFGTVGAQGTTYTATGLPSWARLNSSTGVLTGTPPNATGSPFTITVTSGDGGTVPTITQTFTLTVVAPAPPVFTSSPPSSPATLGTAYSFTCTASGFPAPSNFAVASGLLPTGLSLSPAGVISGTPTTGGLFTGTISVSNGVGSAVTQSFSIEVLQPALFTSNPLNAAATVGTPFSFTFTATGYPPPVFSSYNGFPQGLTLSSAGVLSGTPVSGSGGIYSGTIAADVIEGSYDSEVIQGYTITVTQAPAFGDPPVTSPSVVNGTYYHDFSQGASGYPTPTYSLGSGTLPAGLTLSSAGVLSGTATTVGTYSGTINSFNGVGNPATENFTIIIGNPAAPVFLNAASATATVGIPFSFQFQASGLPAPTVIPVSGTVPGGISLPGYSQFSPASWNGYFVGTPTQSGTFNVTITASNGVNPTATQNFTLTVQPGGFDTWSSTYFTAQQLATPSVSGLSATPENDGVTNLLKYLYDINPSRPMSGPDLGALPVLGHDTTTTPGTTYLTLTYRQYAYATGISRYLQTSSDLVNWTTLNPADILQQVGTDPTTGDPIVEIGVKATGSSQFIRMQVTSP